MKFFLRIVHKRHQGYVIESGEFYTDKSGNIRIHKHKTWYASISKGLVLTMWKRILKRYKTQYFTITKFIDEYAVQQCYALMTPNQEAFNNLTVLYGHNQ